MHKLNRIIISVCSLLMIACSEKKQEESLGVFREVNTYQLDLDRFTSPVEDHYQYVTNWRGEEAYAFHIEAKGQIKLYSLATGALLETLPYALNQPNLQYGIHDFYILNEDSIFLNRRRAYKVYLIDSAYEIIKTLNFMSENNIFGPIHWDPFRNMIYRIMEEPNEDYVPNLLRDPIQRARNMVVMAFDPNQEYKKVAEMRLKKTEKGLFLDRCFVNEKGLNITYLDLENEDKLYFKTFVVE